MSRAEDVRLFRKWAEWVKPTSMGQSPLICLSEDTRLSFYSRIAAYLSEPPSVGTGYTLEEVMGAHTCGFNAIGQSSLASFESYFQTLPPRAEAQQPAPSVGTGYDLESHIQVAYRDGFNAGRRQGQTEAPPPAQSEGLPPLFDLPEEKGSVAPESIIFISTYDFRGGFFSIGTAIGKQFTFYVSRFEYDKLLAAVTAARARKNNG